MENRVFVDYRTGVIEDKHVERERADAVLVSIGSTFQGVGAAMSDRVMRRLRLARDFEALRPYLSDAPSMINDALDAGGKVLVEGTQGTISRYITAPILTSLAAIQRVLSYVVLSRLT